MCTILLGLWGIIWAQIQSSPLPSGTYQVVTEASQVEWEGRKKVVSSSHKGLVPVEGSVTLNQGLPVKGELIFRLKDLTVTDIPANDPDNARLANHLKSSDFFHTEAFPTARFVWSTAKWLEKDRLAQVAGQLTIKDQTHPFTVQATLNRGPDGSVWAEGTTTFNRTQFGVIYGSDQFFKKLAINRIIADEVQLKFRIKTVSNVGSP